MSLSEIDRNLLERCLAREARAWEDFVDRFLGLVVHVVNHTARARSVRLTEEDQEDLCAEVFMTILENDLQVLRHFRGDSSLATYLTVISRRVIVRQLLKRKSIAPLSATAEPSADNGSEERIQDLEEVQRLLEGLGAEEAQIVRMFHLEGKSYREISSQTGVPENSIGPTLSRAREKMRRTAGPAAG